MLRPQPTVRLSELIVQLQALQGVHGDVPVYIDDADTGWSLGIVTVEYEAEFVHSDEHPAGVYIGGKYGK